MTTFLLRSAKNVPGTTCLWRMTTALERALTTLRSSQVSLGLLRVAALRFSAMRLSAAWFFASMLTILALGCAGERSQGAARSPKDSQRIDVPRTVITPDSATSLPEMFAAAQAKARSGDLEGAAALFDRIVAHEPEVELAAPALFASGDAHDTLGHHQAAIARYRAVVEKHPGHDLARSAALRCV